MSDRLAVGSRGLAREVSTAASRDAGAERSSRASCRLFYFFREPFRSAGFSRFARTDASGTKVTGTTYFFVAWTASSTASSTSAMGATVPKSFSLCWYTTASLFTTNKPPMMSPSPTRLALFLMSSEIFP